MSDATNEQVDHWLSRAQELIRDPLNDVTDRTNARHIVALCNRIESDAKRIAEFERVTGPMMSCGCYAVEFEKLTFGLIRCRKSSKLNAEHSVAIEPTPAYLTWKESR